MIRNLSRTFPEPFQCRALSRYHDRWEIENSLDELKTHLRGPQIVLRSKTPALVQQEFYGLLMAHFAIRALMHEAALQAEEDPDRLSFLHAVRVVQRMKSRRTPEHRQLFHKLILAEILQERVAPRRHRINPRGVKRKMSNYPLRPPTQRVNLAISVKSC